MDERIISKKLDILRDRMVLSRTPLGPWEARIARHVGPNRYEFDGDWSPVDGALSVPALRTAFLRTRFEVPAPSADPGTAMLLDFGFSDLESLLSVDGRPWAGVDANHTRVPLPAAGPHELTIEAMSLARAWREPGLRRGFGRFDGAALVLVDRVMEAAWLDLLFTWEAVRAVRDPRRRDRLAAALEAALLEIDLTVESERLRRDAESARALLHERVGDIAPDPEGGRILLAGHTHIDTAWLWPVRETIRKCARTFSTAVRLLEQYPEFHFSCSQAQLYAYVREVYPDLYAEIRKWAKAGRWHTTGALWVESDCNVPSGESLIRQILYGLEFFAAEFGTRPRTCWLPDVFGYPGNLPQILKGCGIDYFFTCKLHWQSTNPFPHHLFHWQGIDGSRVLAHIPKLPSGYNGAPRPEQLAAGWENFREKGVYDELLLPFGYGDGGGGPTAQMLEFAERARTFPGLPATRIAGEEEFYDRAAKTARDLPVWEGELYLETHRGTYTSQSRTKQANRRTELLLREAEVWASLAQMSGTSLEPALLHDAWRRVLLQQFHDILPGSSIGEVYVDAAADHARAAKTAKTVRDRAAAALAEIAAVGGDLTVLNALSWERSDPVEAVIELPGDDPVQLIDSNGCACPAQVVERGPSGAARVVFEPASAPAMGIEGFLVRRGHAPETDAALVADRDCLENQFFRIELDKEGAIIRLLDKRNGREVLSDGARANDWQLFQDGPEREAAWNVHDTFDRKRYRFEGAARIEVVETGPVRATVRVSRKYRKTRITCDIRIYRQTPRIDFSAVVDWRERQTMLKVAFPVAVRSPHATFEVQFGAVERPTHRNTSWEEQKFEVAAQRWMDLSEAGYGVSLLNDSRYGCDVRGNVLRLTLLRGPEYPDPKADLGRHRFVYALLPHLGGWTEGGTVRAAAELNAPLRAVPGLPSAGPPSDRSRSFCRIEGAGVVLDTLKPAQDGDGWIARFYEAHGGRTPVRAAFDPAPSTVVPCNFIEEDPGPALPLTDGAFQFRIEPFQVRTFRIRM
ncbi:MAG: alpha-mannosidase [Kiritimatiellaeota bacterium]|nr:alpha-mannosidase [Kiritimatiellota bacterium]